MTDAKAEVRQPLTLKELVERASRAGSGDTVKVQQILEELGQRSTTALMLLPALLTVSPLSGIPLFSTSAGLLIALVAGQLLLGRKSIWIPGFLRDREVSRKRYQSAMDKVAKAAKVLDYVFRPRLQMLTRRPLSSILQLACFLLALVMPALELIPTSSSIVAAIISLFGIALVTRDGIAALGGIAGIFGASYLAYTWLW
ncbi:exopolysaccharide biosynthesis protein ExoD [Devosia pacifica]|uniref:Exopolysaccharide biosynthesis protein ExoD n=1 Tax=Devosia pacifica TaxID=1335967 RepID=A0A918S0M5_9HYPH|nr:exopolysaccharide biosynthesis protein [Devosia pacifica]GHA18393.1 exopolysaccharide biosynthesis protein ExoD [Devosia pacifica]